MSKLTATIIAALVFVSCSNDSVPDLPPSCEGSGYYEIETHYCYQEVREINAGGKNCIITSTTENGHTYEINCEGKHIGYLDNGKQGEQGESGFDGTNGENCSVKSTDSGVEITCGTMKVPLHGANGRNGKDGIDGKDGEDGTDGKDGIDGQNCEIVSNTKSGVEIKCDGITLPLTNGKDGKDGEDGIDGIINGENCKITPIDDDGVEITCNGVSLNGKKGEKGDTGEAGDDCTIKIKDTPSEGLEITCGTVKTSLGHGKDGENGSVIKIGDLTAGVKGKDGEGCKVVDNGAYWEMTCEDGTGAKWPKAMCMAEAYDPEENFCYENIIMDFCDGKTYNPAKEFCDSRGDGTVYKKTKIGTQTWMAENLNYDTKTTGSACYENEPANCDTYGRLYDWETAMAGSASSTKNPSGVQGVCPSGWHLPSSAEWDTLEDVVNYDTMNLKAKDGWNGQDIHGFAALPGGGTFYGEFDNVGDMGFWWSTREYSGISAYHIYIESNSKMVSWSDYNKSDLFSVRCVED